MRRFGQAGLATLAIRPPDCGSAKRRPPAIRPSASSAAVPEVAVEARHCMGLMRLHAEPGVESVCISAAAPQPLDQLPAAFDAWEVNSVALREASQRHSRVAEAAERNSARQ